MGTVHAFPPKDRPRRDRAAEPTLGSPEFDTDRPVPASENLDAPAVHRSNARPSGASSVTCVRRPRPWVPSSGVASSGSRPSMAPLPASMLSAGKPQAQRAGWAEVLPTPRRRPLAESPLAPAMPRPRRHVVPQHRRPRRWLQVARRLLMLLFAVGLPLALVAWVFTAQQFSLRLLEVHGTERVPAAELLKTLEPYQGKNLLLLPLGEVRRHVLSEHSWLADVSLDKQLPDGLRVEAVARQPVALALDRSGYRYVDAAGQPIARAQPADEPLAQALPQLQGLRSETDVLRCLDLMRQWQRVDAPWRGELQSIEILSDDDFLLRPRGLFPLLVRFGDLEHQASGLTRVLPELRARYPEGGWLLDLRVSGRMVWTRDEAEMTSLPAQRGTIEQSGDAVAVPSAVAGSQNQG